MDVDLRWTHRGWDNTQDGFQEKHLVLQFRVQVNQHWGKWRDVRIEAPGFLFPGEKTLPPVTVPNVADHE